MVALSSATFRSSCRPRPHLSVSAFFTGLFEALITAGTQDGLATFQCIHSEARRYELSKVPQGFLTVGRNGV
jgi:hypothetical protein